MGIKLIKFRGNTTKGVISLLIMVITICMSLQISLAKDTDILFSTYHQTIYSESDRYDKELTNAMLSIIESDFSYFDKKGSLIKYYYQKGDEMRTNVVDYDQYMDHKEIAASNQRFRTYFEQYNNDFYYLVKGEWRNGVTKEANLEVNYNNGDEQTEITAYLGFSPYYFSINQDKFTQSRKSFLEHWIISGVLMLIIGLLTLFMMMIAGLKGNDKKIHLHFIDKIYSEVLIIVYLIFGYNAMQIIWQDIIYYNEPFELMIVLTSFIMVSVIVILSITRKVKASVLFQNSLLYKLHQIMIKSGRDLYHYILYSNHFRTSSQTKILYLRQLIISIVSAVCFMLTFLFALIESPLISIPIILFVLILYWYNKGNNYIYQKLNKGLEESLEEQMKSERMKIALITNVSHDLKTPLTSIISYVDLLSKEEGLTDTANDYVKILQNKSDRLKNIVTDLFELAKSTSGNIAIEEECIDLKRLIEQTLADMEDKINDSDLQFKTALPDEPIMIKSDGKKLYRVFQNIIDNALKYSLKHTRVYINLIKIDQRAMISIKNIAAYEMNFTQEEILQRFYRGDQSRSTDGSGLGLSIAESFANNCGGKLEVEIDGDVFKVMIAFHLEPIETPKMYDES